MPALNYEFGSIVVNCPKLKNILDELTQIDAKQVPHLSFIIVGESGCGKSTMAQYIQKHIYKNQDIVIQKNVSQRSEIRSRPAIVTASIQNWVQLRHELKDENLKVVVMPTLKERKADLLPLADFFLQVLGLMSGRTQMKLTEKAAEMILQYGWPGQFHEFEAVLEAAYETACSQSAIMIEPQFLNINKLPQILDMNVGMKLEEIERNFILQTLYFVHQNRTKAAEILGISIRTLRNKINQYRQEGYL